MTKHDVTFINTGLYEAFFSCRALDYRVEKAAPADAGQPAGALVLELAATASFQSARMWLHRD